jgi:hypothetical protein
MQRPPRRAHGTAEAHGSRHRSLEADELVGDLAAVMARDCLPGGERQHLDTQICALGDDFLVSNINRWRASALA